MSDHALYAVELGSAVLGGITEQDAPVESDVSSEQRSGSVYARRQSLRSQTHRPTFTTEAIRSAVDLIPFLGKRIPELAGGFSQYAYEFDDQGPMAGAVHRRFTFDKGLIVPQRLSVQGNGDATIGYVVFALSADGKAKPYAIVENVAVPAETAGTTEAFGLGPARVADILINQVNSLDIEFGINVAPKSDGATYEKRLSIQSIHPVVTVRGTDIKVIGGVALDPEGEHGVHVDTSFYLRRRKQYGTFETDASAAHIKFTGDGFVTPETLFAAQSGREGEVALTVPLRHDGTNYPLMVTTGVAIAA